MYLFSNTSISHELPIMLQLDISVPMMSLQTREQNIVKDYGRQIAYASECKSLYIEQN